MIAKAKKPELELRVDFGNVNLGDGTASIRCTVVRERLNIVAADEGLCGKRLVGKIVLGTFSEKQAKLFDDVDYEVDGAFDVKSVLVKPKTIGFGLAFALESIDVEQLSHFAKKQGALVIMESETLDNGDDDEDENGAE